MKETVIVKYKAHLLRSPLDALLLIVAVVLRLSASVVIAVVVVVGHGDQRERACGADKV